MLSPAPDHVTLPVPSLPPVSDLLRNLAPYVPGKPIEETQREFGIRKVIKLASNENPLGPSPRALKAIRGKPLKQLHRYPDASAFRLKQRLSRELGVAPESICLGNGSNEVIEFLIRAFCAPGDCIAAPRYSFVAYRISAQVHGVISLESELGPGLEVDLDALLKVIRDNDRVKLVFLANPNNPTGIHVPATQLRSFLAKLRQVRGGTVLAVLDYAYWEYVDSPEIADPRELLREFANTVVLRTFSKIHGLAGLRVGYGVAAPQITALLEKVRTPFNVSSLGLLAAAAALGDAAFLKKAHAVNRAGLAFWQKELTRLRVPFYPSQGNFLLIDAQQGFGKSGLEVYQECLKKGVIFRPVANYGLPWALRVSVGTAQENRSALRVLSALVASHRKSEAVSGGFDVRP
jgi:histidinol-phosphate aminotransferase